MISKPIIYQSKEKVPKDANFIDEIGIAVKELFFLENPSLPKMAPETQALLSEAMANPKIETIWAYYPHAKTALHLPEEKVLYRLQTARNYKLIPEAEQNAFRNLTIGIAGLSVGSAVLHQIVQSGGPKTIKIADFDTLEFTNLNRIRGNLFDIGKKKTDIAAEAVYKFDPFCNLHIYENGVSEETLNDFILGAPKLDVFIDEMDDIYMKLYARKLCKENGIPVLMAGDNGEAGVIDVERYDLDKNIQMLNGLIGEVDVASFKSVRPGTSEWQKVVGAVFNPPNFTMRHQEVFIDFIGRKIAGPSQLGSTAAINGSIMSYFLRRLANGESLPSQRYNFNPEALIPEFNTPESEAKRKEHTQKFIEILQSNF